MSTKSASRDTIAGNTLKVQSGTAAVFNLDLDTSVPVGSGIANIVSVSSVVVDPTGTKLFCTTVEDGYVRQYELPFPGASLYRAVATGVSNVQINESPSTSGLFPSAKIEFSADGTKLFVTHVQISSSNSAFRRYSLGAPWDITSMSLDGGANTITALQSAQTAGFPYGTTTPRSIRFNADGTKVFLLDPIRQELHGVNLPAPWSLNGAYNVFRKYLAEDVTAMRFIDNGTKLIVLNGTTDDLMEYTLPNPYEHYNANLTANLQLKRDLYDIAPTGFDFSMDGTKIYVADSVSDSIIQYNLNTPWLISSGNLYQEDIKRLRVTTEETTPSGITFSDDGNYMYLVGTTSDRLHQYSLSEPWNPNTASNIAAISINAQDTDFYTLYYGNSGYSIYIQGTASDDVNQYNMTVPGDITTATFAGLGKPSTWGITGSVSTDPTVTTGMTFSPDGTTVYIAHTSTYGIYPFKLRTPWDITTVCDLELKFMQGAGSNPRGLRFGNAGYNLYYLVGSAAANVNQYSLAYPYEVGTGTFEKHFSPLPSPPADTSGSGLTLSEDGSNLYIVGYTYDNISQYTLTTPWDVSTAVYAGNLNMLPITSNPAGMRFNPEGNIAYVISDVSDRIHQLELGIPWMISTASNVAAKIISATEAVGTDLYIANNGITLFTIGDTIGGYAEWAMSTPWDITTATYTGVNGAIEGTATTADFRPDGKVTVGSGVISDSTILQYMPNAWSLSTMYEGFFDPNATGRSLYAPRWSNTGTSLFVVDRSGSARILQYTANVPYDLYSIIYSNKLDTPSFLTANFEVNVNAIEISKDNRYLYILGDNQDTIYRFEFLDPSNPRLDQLKSPITPITQGEAAVTPQELLVLPNGNILVTISAYTGTIREGVARPGIVDFSMGDSNIWTKSNIASNVYFNTTASAGDTSPIDIRFVNNGYRAFILGGTNDDVTQHNLSEPYNIATAKKDTGNIISLNADISTLTSSMAISDGQYLFFADTTGDSVYRYKLFEANSLNGIAFKDFSGSDILSLSEYDTLGTSGHASIDFNTDGTKMFYCPRAGGTGSGGDQVNSVNGQVVEFNLPQPYDIGGAVQTGNRANTYEMWQSGDIYDMAFSRDGKVMYAVDAKNPTATGYAAKNHRLIQIYFIDKNTLYSR